MAYMPAELNDDDDDFEEGRFEYDEDGTSPSQSHLFDCDHRHHDYDYDVNTPNSNDYLKSDSQRKPGVNKIGNVLSQSQASSSFQQNTSTFGKQKKRNTGQAVKSLNASSSTNHSFVSTPLVKPSFNVLTDDDLKIACAKGNVNIVQQCLQQGLPINEVLSGGWTPLMFACSQSQSLVVELLLKEGADPSYHVDLFSPLMCACCTSALGTERLDCLKMLVTAGADVNAMDRHHTTGLMLASRLGYLDLVEYLIEKGAKVNKQDSRGWTALTWSVQRGHKDIALSLLESGADCNIKHTDRLTVKDMAAHMPTDEMLALLERRPVISSNSGDMTDIGIEGGGWGLKIDPALASQHSILDENDDGVRSTDLRYGELEIFLLGLDLPHLVPLFQKHLIDLYLLLDMTEQDLINAGVEQLGARKKILDASQAVHKKNWEPSSLVSIHYNKQIWCSDALAMIANISKHIRYINSTVIYIRQHLKHHPNSLLQATDRATPTQLARHVADTSKHVQLLQKGLTELQENLIQEMKNFNVNPPDLIPSQKSACGSSSFLSRRYFCISCGVIVVAAGLGFMWRDGNVTDYIQSFIRHDWYKLLR